MCAIIFFGLASITPYYYYYYFLSHTCCYCTPPFHYCLLVMSTPLCGHIIPHLSLLVTAAVHITLWTYAFVFFLGFTLENRLSGP